MPYLVSTAFSSFLEKITIPGDARKIASTRRDGVLELLDKKLTILDSFATGSLVRGTGLKSISDVDVMLVLHYGNHLKDKTPMQALELVRDALSDYNAKIVKKNGQAVTLYFVTWPNVDVVPAKRVGTDSNYVLHIPDTTTGEWIPTDPGAHDQAMSGVSNRKRQLIRMLKCWNAAHSGYFSSFHIEQVVLETWVDETDSSERGWLYDVKSFFAKALELTESSARMSASYGVSDWLALRSRLNRGRELATQAWTAAGAGDYETAIGKCQMIFGNKFPAYG